MVLAKGYEAFEKDREEIKQSDIFRHVSLANLRLILQKTYQKHVFGSQLLELVFFGKNSLFTVNS